MVLPFPCAIIGAGTQEVSYGDCEEETLELLSTHFNVGHLSECTDPDMLKFPIPGVIHGVGNRLVVPLKVRAQPESKDLIVYFVVDPGAPFTSFGAKTAEKLFGKNTFKKAIIQDVRVTCSRSGDMNKVFQNVNLLGSQFFTKSNNSIIVSPHSFDYLSDNIRVFYLAPFSMISEAQTMAASRQQSVDVAKKLQVRVVNKLSSSDPTGNQQKVAEKAFPALEKSDTRPSASLTSGSDKQMPSHHGSSMDLS
ncbi:hypothetical protein M3Y94_00449400 [Aphelenchoides besseyi]|nr:hypothetical protein M3Y94_00449400 [Aphelenchoides besseyi]